MSGVEKATKVGKQLLTAGMVCGIAGIIGIILNFVLLDTLIANKSYFLIGLIVFVCGAALYSAVFMMFASFDRAVAVALIPVAIEVGTDDITGIAKRMGWRIKATYKYVRKCQKWGYLH